MRHSVSRTVPAGTGIAEKTPSRVLCARMSFHLWRRRNMEASASNARASGRAPRKGVATLVESVDEIVIRVTDRAPSTPVLWAVLGISLFLLLLLALIPAKRGGTSDAFGDAQHDGTAQPTAVAGTDTGSASASVAPSVTARDAPAVAAAGVIPPPVGADTATTIAPVISPGAASAAPIQRMEMARRQDDARAAGRTDAPARVVDMTRSAPLAPNAAEIVRAEPLNPRLADSPRSDTPVGATSGTIESTLASGVARSREDPDAAAAREQSPKPAEERAPSAEPAAGSTL